MNLREFFADTVLKGKEKTEILSQALIEKRLILGDLISFCAQAKEAQKATCIEAIEFASRINVSLVNEKCFQFISESLADKAPRIKWESAKVIGNTAHLFPENLDLAITNLLVNAEHNGTVVRWAAAFALGEIVCMETKYAPNLIPALQAICKHEQKNSIKKIYLKALKGK